MDSPVEEEAAARSTAQRMWMRRRIGSRRLLELALNFAISFAILSLLKLQPIAHDSVRDHNSNIDLPHQEEKVLKSTDDDANNKIIQESERSSSSSSVVSAGKNISVRDENRHEVGAMGNGNARLFFCGNSKWKDTNIGCNERVSYLIQMYGTTLFKAKESLLKQGCACSSSAKQQINNVNTTKTITIREESIQSSFLLAPWDASEAVGGSELIKNACQKEIEQSQCHGKLPLYNCLVGYFLSFEQLSPECKRVVNRCSVEGRNFTISGRRGCRAIIRAFQHSALNGIEARRLDSLLQRMDVSFENKNIQYMMAAGSTIGSLYHHSRVPWDDDVDMYVLDKDLIPATIEFYRNGLAVRSQRNGGGRFFKIFDPSMPAISAKHNHSYPFVDIFPIHCNETMCAEKNDYWAGGEITYPKDWIFPLKWRPFGRNSLPFPNKLTDVVKIRYGEDVKGRCIRPAYYHKMEMLLGPENHIDVSCDDLPLPPPGRASFQGRAMEDRPFIRPWASDLPDVTVEHLMDNNTRLSTVTFYDGNEIRRSYADGLMNTNGKITFHVSSKPTHPTPLIPFLLEERESYARNVAARSSKDLNLEVMPMLDIPEVGNDFVGESLPDRSPTRLTIAGWNAKRGTNWHVFPNFIPDADIIILNEMDWGMARSGNNHTIRSMAKSLRMNYAYGVEFLELTNGNAGEINATIGMKNAAGYHGNAVLSKWRISDVSIVRLHPLYDLLYQQKTVGMAKGERRLGGRMALFATTHIGNDTILLVSVHSHADSKGHLFQEDAKMVCDEIQRRNATNVLLGGDTGPPFITPLVSDCGFYPLEKTNKKNGRKFQPTWRVDCPNGDAPRARFQRGDWLLARGAGFSSLSLGGDDDNTTLSVVYPYIMKDKKYECISDHAMITMETDFLPGTGRQ